MDRDAPGIRRNRCGKYRLGIGMNLHLIQNEEEYDTAIADIERLWGAPADTPDRNHLQVLTILVEAYERIHHPIDPPDPIEALRYAAEKKGLTRRDLEPYLGSRGRVTEILNRRRPLTIDMIRRLHDGLGISAASLIQPYEIQPPTRRPRAATRQVSAP